MIFVAVFGLLILAIMITTLMHFWLGAPYVPTPPALVRAMVDAAQLQPGQTVVDLGAGDGRLLIEAKRRQPGIRAIGYELVPTVWLLGKICTFFSRTRVTFLCRDARRANLRDADCIFLYLLPGVLEQLMPLFKRDLKPGTRVISSVFRLPGIIPSEEIPVEWMGEKRKVRVYVWGDQ